MKTPVLTLLPKHTSELLDSSINSALDTCEACSNVKTTCSMYLMQALYGLCYKVFFYDGKFITNSKYTVADACIYIPGMFKQEMVRFLTDIAEYSEVMTSVAIEKLLSNCLSYELVQMLYREPVRVYAALLYTYALDILDDELMELGRKYLAVKPTQPTLAWECMYLKFMERYE